VLKTRYISRNIFFYRTVQFYDNFPIPGAKVSDG